MPIEYPTMTLSAASHQFCKVTVEIACSRGDPAYNCDQHNLEKPYVYIFTG